MAKSDQVIINQNAQICFRNTLPRSNVKPFLTVVEDVMSVFFVIKSRTGVLIDPVTVNCLCALFYSFVFARGCKRITKFAVPHSWDCLEWLDYLNSRREFS